MGSVEKMPVAGNIERVLKPLEDRVRQCTKLKVLLLQYLVEREKVTGDTDTLRWWRQYAQDFEIKAIEPVRAYVERLRKGVDDRSEAHQNLVALNTWVAPIEKEFPIVWQNVRNADIMPFKRSVEHE